MSRRSSGRIRRQSSRAASARRTASSTSASPASGIWAWTVCLTGWRCGCVPPEPLVRRSWPRWRWTCGTASLPGRSVVAVAMGLSLSVPGEVEVFERHDRAAAAALVAVLECTEVTDPGEPGAVEDDQLHPRQVQPEAGMDARSEGRVAIERTFDRHLLGLVVELGVPADDGQRCEDAVARPQSGSAELGVL